MSFTNKSDYNALAQTKKLMLVSNQYSETEITDYSSFQSFY